MKDDKFQLEQVSGGGKMLFQLCYASHLNISYSAWLVLHGGLSFMITFFSSFLRLEVWPGFVTAIQEYEDGVMLCCDASYRVIRKETVSELM